MEKRRGEPPLWQLRADHLFLLRAPASCAGCPPYRTGSALGWHVPLTSVGCRHHHGSTATARRSTSPGFQPVAFALDLIPPILDLGQERALVPSGDTAWGAWVSAAVGWILATTAISSLTRRLARSGPCPRRESRSAQRRPCAPDVHRSHLRQQVTAGQRLRRAVLRHLSRATRSPRRKAPPDTGGAFLVSPATPPRRRSSRIRPRAFARRGVSRRLRVPQGPRRAGGTASGPPAWSAMTRPGCTCAATPREAGRGTRS